MAHEFAFGDTQPERTIVENGVISILTPLLRTPTGGGYLLSLAKHGAPVRSYTDEPGINTLQQRIGRAPGIAVVTGTLDIQPTGIGLDEALGELELLLYFSTNHQRNAHDGRQEIDVVGMADNRADPGLHVILKHARELILGQRAGATKTVKQIFPVREEELATLAAITIWQQVYRVRVHLKHNNGQWRDAAQLLTSIGWRITAADPPDPNRPAAPTSIVAIDGDTSVIEGDGDDSIPGVTRDALNRNYYPANAAEWATFFLATGQSGLPSSANPMQDLSGNLLDTIGPVHLAPQVPGHQYQVTVLGTSRKGVRGIDGTSNQRWDNTTTAPNANLTSVGLLMNVDFPAPPATICGICLITGSTTTGALRWNTNGTLRLLSGGAAANLLFSVANTRTWLYFQINRTAGTAKVFTKFEKFSGAYTLPASAINMLIGGAGGAAGPISAAVNLYSTTFTGAAAERTDAQAKALLQSLGEAIPWS